MQYLVVFSPDKKFKTDGPPADFAEVELKEQAQARVLYAGGGARQVWALGHEKVLGGVVLFEADSPAHLQEMIDSFPLVKARYAEPVIYPIGPHAAFKPKP